MSVIGNRSVVFSGYCGFLHQYNWNIVESAVKHHKPTIIFVHFAIKCFIVGIPMRTKCASLIADLFYTATNLIILLNHKKTLARIQKSFIYMKKTFLAYATTYILQKKNIFHFFRFLFSNWFSTTFFVRYQEKIRQRSMK